MAMLMNATTGTAPLEYIKILFGNYMIVFGDSEDHVY
jgi:hypothetical protein